MLAADPLAATHALAELARHARALAVTAFLDEWARHLDAEGASQAQPKLVAWGELFEAVRIHVVPALLAYGAHDDERLIAAWLFALELATCGQVDLARQMFRIADGSLALDAALRARPADAFRAAYTDPAVLLEIAEADQVVLGEAIFPVPSGSEPRGDDEAGRRAFVAFGELAALRERYLGWVRLAGWRVEQEATHDLRIARGAHRLVILFSSSHDGRKIVSIGPVDPSQAVTFRPAPVRPPPALPAVTRRYPPSIQLGDVSPGEIEAAACDRGLLYVATSVQRIDLIDPATGVTRTLVGNTDLGSREGHVDTVALGRPASLVCDDAGLWFVDRGWSELRRLDFATETVTIVARELARPTHLARIAGTFYVAAEDAHLRAIDAATGAVRPLTGRDTLARTDLGWTVTGLAAVGDRLYTASDDGGIRAVDPATGAVEKIADLPGRPLSLASDGRALYVGDRGFISHLDIATRRHTVIAGAIASDDTVADGPGLRARIGKAACLVWDGAAGLYFFDGDRVRWLDLFQRYVVTAM